MFLASQWPDAEIVSQLAALRMRSFVPPEFRKVGLAKLTSSKMSKPG
jgi:hypothetical protein